MLRFITVVLLTIPLAQSANAMTCTTRFAKSAEAKLFLMCPSDGRAGFVSEPAFNIGTAEVVLRSSDGQIREMKVPPKMLAGLFGPSDASGMTASIATLTERLSRGTTNGEIDLSPGEIRILGLDPNAVGSTKLSVRSVIINDLAVLVDEKGEISKYNSVSKNSKSKCLYVGNMKVISQKSSSPTCAVGPSLCIAELDCKDGEIGWVSRAVACKSVDGRCPVSADTCVADESGPQFMDIKLQRSAKPTTREAGTKR